MLRRSPTSPPTSSTELPPELDALLDQADPTRRAATPSDASPVVLRGLAAAERTAGLHGRRHTAFPGGHVSYEDGYDPAHREPFPLPEAFRTPRNQRPTNVPLEHPKDREDPLPFASGEYSSDLQRLLAEHGIVL